MCARRTTLPEPSTRASRDSAPSGTASAMTISSRRTATWCLALDRLQELVDRQRRQRLDLRRPSGAEGDGHTGDRRSVRRLDDVDEVELAERRPLVEHLAAELLDVLV